MTTRLVLPELPAETQQQWEPSTRLILLGAVYALVVGLMYRSWNEEPFQPIDVQLSESEMAQVQKLVPPTPQEDDFDKIPWRTSIWQARQEAAKEGKPILLWEMDGHPLGCG